MRRSARRARRVRSPSRPTRMTRTRATPIAEYRALDLGFGGRRPRRYARRGASSSTAASRKRHSPSGHGILGWPEPTPIRDRYSAPGLVPRQEHTVGKRPDLDQVQVHRRSGRTGHRPDEPYGSDGRGSADASLTLEPSRVHTVSVHARQACRLNVAHGRGAVLAGP